MTRPHALPSPGALTLRRIDSYLAARAELEAAAWMGGPRYEAALFAHTLALSHIGSEVEVSVTERIEVFA